MINQANRRPGHATCSSTRPVEAIRPRIHLSKNTLSDNTFVSLIILYGFSLEIQLFFGSFGSLKGFFTKFH